VGRLICEGVVVDGISGRVVYAWSLAALRAEATRTDIDWSGECEKFATEQQSISIKVVTRWF
jgi:hypothetical protein